MQALNNDEILCVSGSGAVSNIVTTGTVVGGAQVGSYLTAARLGATFGSAAGPIGAVAGALIVSAACYYWRSKYASE